MNEIVYQSTKKSLDVPWIRNITMEGTVEEKKTAGRSQNSHICMRQIKNAARVKGFEDSKKGKRSSSMENWSCRPI